MAVHPATRCKSAPDAIRPGISEGVFGHRLDTHGPGRSGVTFQCGRSTLLANVITPDIPGAPLPDPFKVSEIRVSGNRAEAIMPKVQIPPFCQSELPA